MSKVIENATEVSNKRSFVKMAKVNTTEVQNSVLNGRDRKAGVRIATIVESDDDLMAIEKTLADITEVSKDFKDDIKAKEFFKEEIQAGKAVKNAIINSVLADEETMVEVEQEVDNYVETTFGGFTSNYIR